MNFTTTITSKGQITIPRLIRESLGIKKGIKLQILPIEGGFIGKPHRQSRILEFAGDLKHLDKVEPLSEIRAKSQAEAAKVIAKRLPKK